jgi:hypothetical protein
MVVNPSLYSKSSVQRVHLPGEQGGRGVTSFENLHDRVVLGVSVRMCVPYGLKNYSTDFTETFTVCSY